PAITVFDDVSDCSAITPPVEGCNQPVKRCDQHIFPLIPDSGKTQAEGDPRLSNGHFGVRARTECLTHHDPPFEFPVTSEIIITTRYFSGYPKTKGNDTDKVNNEDNVVDEGHIKTVLE